MDTLEKLLQGKIVAIIRKVKPQQMFDTVSALYEGGIRLVEVTFDHTNKDTIQETVESLKIINERLGDKVLLGAGTVLTAEHVDVACECGARYIISPDVNVSVIKRTKELGLVSLPGALTPTEIMTAANAGADVVKLFPAGVLGLDYIKAVMGPLSHIPYFAVGGVDEKNIRAFMDAGIKGFGIGGSLVDTGAVKAGDFWKLTEKARGLIGAVS